MRCYEKHLILHGVLFQKKKKMSHLYTNIKPRDRKIKVDKWIYIGHLEFIINYL